MPLETAQFIHQLDPANPASTDQLAQADDHLRLLKQVLKNTFPNINAPVTATDEQLNAPFVMPVGGIISWFGASNAVPAGWALCDGRTVDRSDGTGTITTPDLRDRVVIGAGTLLDLGETAGDITSSVTTAAAGDHTHGISGGDHSHTGKAGDHALSVDEIPSHRHFEFANAEAGYGNVSSTNTPNKNGSGSSSGASYAMGGGSTDATVGRSSAVGGGKAHSHDLQVDNSSHSHTIASGGSHSHAVTVSTVQPSLALHHIMKI